MTMDINIKTKKIIFSGNVQGVGFRFNTWRFARKLKLTGWVQNDSEGTVTVIAQGEEKNIKALINYLKLLYKQNIEEIKEENITLQNCQKFEIKK
ncbi:MAG: acylphosphatase [Minisyncoccia bacterium]